MVKKRIICTLLWGETGLVKPRSFGEHRARGSMMDAVRVMDRRGVDEIILLDITATPNNRGPRFDEIKEFTGELFCPVTVGGGVRSVEDVIGLLHAGADKVAICTGYWMDPGLIPEAAEKVGKQAIVAAIDVKTVWTGPGKCWSSKRPTFECGKGQTTIMSPGGLAMGLEALGAGEILLTSIDRDGTMEGYDLDLIAAVANNAGLKIPVIASGGCSGPEDMEQAFYLGADACAAGALFQFTDATPRYCAQYLHKMNIPVRIPPPMRLQ